MYYPRLELLLLAVLAAPAPAAGETGLSLDEQELAARLWRQSPELIAARGMVADADATAYRARLLPNPGATLSWGTIPLGEHNPPGLPFSQIPNYVFSVGQLVELGKRGPRRLAADLGRRGAELSVMDLYRTRFFDLLASLGGEAGAVARRGVLERLVAGSQETLRLQRLRAEKGDVAALEVDRLEVEHLRLVSSLEAAGADAEAAGAQCARILGQTCPRFAGETDANAFLQVEAGADADDAAGIAARPDVLALDAERRKAEAEAVLARRQSVPDPTVSAGFDHDQFVRSGNQANSVALSLSLPLPVFDRGQPEQIRAARRAQQAEQARAAVIEVARRAARASRRQVALLAERSRHLSEQALPMAQSVARRVEEAARRGGAALPEVLLARRAMEELQLDLVDVKVAAFSARLDLRRASGLVPDPGGEVTP